MQEDELRFVLPPQQGAQAAPRSYLDKGPPHDRRSVERQAELLGVLVEQAEFVIFEMVHRPASFARVPAQEYRELWHSIRLLPTVGRTWGNRRSSTAQLPVGIGPRFGMFSGLEHLGWSCRRALPADSFTRTFP